MSCNKNLLALLASLALIVFAVTGLAPAYAATPAGTVIGNAATATYRDDDNNEYTTTSNIVQSVVLAICGVDVTPSGAMSYQAIPGQTVYVPVTVTNTGNSINIFTVGLGGFTYAGNVYVDENGNGLVDPGEPLVGAGVELNMGETKELLLALVVPPTATPPTSDTGTVTVTGTAPAGCSDTTGNITVNVVNDAVIMATKDVDKDTSVPGGTLNYTIRFKNVGTKQAYSRIDAYSVDVDDDGALNAAVDGILVYDQLPPGTSYTAASASGAPGSNPFGFVVYSDNGTDWWRDEANVVGTISHVGYFLPDNDWNGAAYTADAVSEPVLDIDQQGSLSYAVTVDTPFLIASGLVVNSATVYYRTMGGVDTEVTTNTVQTAIPTAVAADVAVSNRVVDPYTNVEEDAGNNYQDDNTKASVPAGSWVVFTHSAANRATVADVINLDAINVPAGWIVEFWNSNGSAKLIDNDGDGKVDLGTVSGQTRRDFTVKVFVPANTANAAYFFDVRATSGNDPTETDLSRDNISAVVTAAVDIARYAVAGDGVNDPSDGNTDPGVGNADSDDVLPIHTAPANPGASVFNRLQVVNVGGSADAYALAAAGIPAGTQVIFYQDNNCNGTVDGADAFINNTPLLGGTVVETGGVLNGANTDIVVYSVAAFTAGDTVRLNLAATTTISAVDPVTRTITLAGDHTGANTAPGVLVSESYCVIMEIRTAANAPAGEHNIVVSIASGASGSSDNMDVYLSINEICAISIAPPASDQIPAGGTTTYVHTVTNTGNSTKFVKIDMNTAGLQLTYLFVAEGANWLTVGPDGIAGTGDDVALADGDPAALGTIYASLTPGASASFKVKVFAPAGTTVGTVESATVQAIADSDGDFINTLADQCTASTSETTTVIDGFLQVTKSRLHIDTNADGITPGPGDTITYRLEYKNIGDKNALNCVIIDPIPNHTDYVAGSLYLDNNCDGSIDGGDTSLTDGSGDDTAEYDAGNNLVRFRVGAGANATSGGTVAPGQSGCVIFQVLIR
ncbi:MAG: hypothetical protein QMD09_01790 [Desulfatibacillaceae bacterium]|nr:hypothetical protein [Desulfatibacillaceae bacterium]